VTVTTPGGRIETVPVDPDTGVAFFGDTAAAGVYRYRIGKKEDSASPSAAASQSEGAFAVNSGGRLESNLHPAEDLGFKPEMLDASELASSRPGGRALWPYLLFAAALLLAVEAFVFHRRIYF
jgi:hypothetical protein